MSAQERALDYANAFYEAAADRWLTALNGAVDKLDQQPELRKRLLGGEPDFAQHQKLVDGLLPADADAPVRNLLYTLAQRGDLELLADLTDALEQRVHSVEIGLVEVEVTSAVPLIETERQALVEGLERQHGKGIAVHYRVDPGILGGLIIRVGDKLLDKSVASRLAAMKHTLGIAPAG